MGLEYKISFPVQVHESFPFSIALTWKGTSTEVQNGSTENQQSVVLFPKGYPIPSLRALTFNRSSTFTVDVQHAEDSEFQGAAKISTATVHTDVC